MPHNRKGLVAIGLAAMLAIAAPAHADVLITDETGETSTFGACFNNDCTGVGGPYEPAIDLASADIALQSGDLVFAITVVDIDHPGSGLPWTRPEDTTLYSFGFSVSGQRVSVFGSRDFGHTSSTGVAQANAVDFVPVVRPATVSFDDIDNTVRVTLSVSDLDDLVSEACPGCGPVGTGSVLSDLGVNGQVMRTAGPVGVASLSTDSATTGSTFTI